MSISAAWPGEAVHGRLMDHDARIGQAETLALGAGRQQHRCHGSCLSHAKRHDIGPHEAHRVQNRQTGRDRAARRVDVNRDVPLGVLRLQEQQLRDDQVRNRVIDRRTQKDDVFFQQTRIDIVCAFTPGGLLDYHGDQNGMTHRILLLSFLQKV